MNIFLKLLNKFKGDNGDVNNKDSIQIDQQSNAQKKHLAARTVDIENDRWWFLPHGKSRSGPFTLEELKTAYLNESNINRLAIRKDGDPGWVKWVNAKTVFPSLAEFFNTVDKNNVVSKTDERLEDLVNRLVFYQHEPIFLNALREATALAPKGDDLGVRALSEAIRRRSGKKDIVFYAPSFGGLTTRQSKEIMEAESKLLELAKSGILIKDPAKTQNLISAALCASDDDLNSFVKDIFMVAGAEQGYDFQLLFNQINSSIKLKYAHGERSWTQKMMNDENEKYFEVPVQVTSFRCSDTECTCAGTDELIAGKTGYLLITEEIFQLRKDALTWEELTTKLRKIQANTDSIISFHVNPIFMCKESALNHGINLEIAASDAKKWADSGLCPLRVTPIDNSSEKNKHVTVEKVWWLLQDERGAKKQGPFTISQLRKTHLSLPSNIKVSVRKGKQGQWFNVEKKSTNYENILKETKRMAKRDRKKERKALKERQSIQYDAQNKIGINLKRSDSCTECGSVIEDKRGSLNIMGGEKLGNYLAERAWICGFCSTIFCLTCAQDKYLFTCPNCGGSIQ